MKKKSLQIVFLLLMAFSLVGCDGVTKWMASSHLKGKPAMKISKNIDLHYAENRDVAFSLLYWIPSTFRKKLILTMGVLGTLFILTFFFMYAREHLMFGLGMALVLSGALGNLLDRFFRGYVVDFIYFHTETIKWPIFNVADICVSCGIAIIGFVLFFQKDAPDFLMLDEDEDPALNMKTWQNPTGYYGINPVRSLPLKVPFSEGVQRVFQPAPQPVAVADENNQLLLFSSDDLAETFEGVDLSREFSYNEQKVRTVKVELALTEEAKRSL